MQKSEPKTILRQDYRAADWAIDRTSLHFELRAESTRVSGELTLRWQSPASPASRVLVLDGVGLKLQSLSIDGVVLDNDRYHAGAETLTVYDLPDSCVLRTEAIINPMANTALEGLYLSSGNFCTQCEAEGFRKITYYLDRPDVLSVFDVTIDAEQSRFPVLLSNGNQVSADSLPNGWHRVQWHDPHPKPCYLFALVAGELSVVQDAFTTASGRDVLLEIYVQSHNIDRCDYAMHSLKAAMAWDESIYGLEYDLDRFMIVAVDDFNMGAMENKGLNIFNSRYVLADQATATDADYLGVEAVIAHEYFHNWTGNRITCRDWFQLSLKEGLTVFRDQCFSSDRHSATVKRIEDVRILRASQFPEDAGPMAHPIRPDSYIEINNFYTRTVYEKGAEVIRMLHTLLGDEVWHSGMRVYVDRHDGSATTCDAFIDAMQSVTDTDLTQFRRWYSTAGTPTLEVAEHYDESASCYRLTISQSTPDTPGQSDKQPLHIPLVMGLLDSDGQPVPVTGYRTVGGLSENSFIVDVREETQTLVFENIDSPPIASLLRGFSAPVKLQQEIDDAALAFLMAHDTDQFNRWEAGQRLGARVILRLLSDAESDDSEGLQLLVGALQQVLDHDGLAPSFKAEVLTFPSLGTLADALQQVDYQHLNAKRRYVQGTLAQVLADKLEILVTRGRDPALQLLDPEAMGMRKLANVALDLLTCIPDSGWQKLAFDQYERADNMTDRLAALACLCHSDCHLRTDALDHFYAMARSDRLTLDKWFSVQAQARRAQIVDDVLNLRKHADYDAANPNRIRALVASFAMANPVGFHSPDGRGYQFLADEVIALNVSNPQVAARLVGPLTRWRQVYPAQQVMMKAALQSIQASGQLSPDVYELITKSLH
jgi:aminopeptidase N